MITVSYWDLLFKNTSDTWQHITAVPCGKRTCCMYVRGLEMHSYGLVYESIKLESNLNCSCYMQSTIMIRCIMTFPLRVSCRELGIVSN